MSIIRPSVSHSQTKHDSTNVGRVEIIVVLLPVKITNQSSSIPQTTTYTTIINLSHCHSDSCYPFTYKYFNALKQFRRALSRKEELTNRLSGSTAMTVFSRPFFCFFFLGGDALIYCVYGQSIARQRMSTRLRILRNYIFYIPGDVIFLTFYS